MDTVENVDAVAAVARIHHSAVAAWAISTAWEIGALDALKQCGALNVLEFAESKGLEPQSTLGMFRALATANVVHRVGDEVTPGDNFAEVCRTRSFFHWMTQGTGEVFRNMPRMLRQENRNGSFTARDGAAISFACREINAVSYDPWFWRAIDALDFDVRKVVDLGCGSGQRLIDLLRRFPSAEGVGIDIAPSALALAEAEARRAGLVERTSFVQADATAMVGGTHEFADVDLLTCFMMGHDFWPRERCHESLSALRAIFPNVRRFVLGDATRTTGVADRDLPIFALAFELAHDVMGAYLPTVEEWREVLGASGWRVSETHWINIAVSEVIFELVPA